jgi:hypothetical protein
MSLNNRNLLILEEREGGERGGREKGGERGERERGRLGQQAVIFKVWLGLGEIEIEGRDREIERHR